MGEGGRKDTVDFRNHTHKNTQETLVSENKITYRDATHIKSIAIIK